MRTKLNKFLTLFTVGGSLYFIIEFLFKTFISGGMIHWSMFLLGGLCFILIGEINEVIPWEMSIIKQGAIGAAIVTSLEFVFGVILNLVLKLGIWDYSNITFQYIGASLSSFLTRVVRISSYSYLPRRLSPLEMV